MLKIVLELEDHSWVFSSRVCRTNGELQIRGRVILRWVLATFLSGVDHFEADVADFRNADVVVTGHVEEVHEEDEASHENGEREAEDEHDGVRYWRVIDEDLQG